MSSGEEFGKIILIFMISLFYDVKKASVVSDGLSFLIARAYPTHSLLKGFVKQVGTSTFLTIPIRAIMAMT